MRMFSAVVAALCLAGSAAAAQTATQTPAQVPTPAPQPDPFMTYCVDTDAQSAPALAKADAAGWATLPPEQVKFPPSAGFSLDTYAVRLKAAADAATVLVVGQGTAGSAGLSAPADVCLVVSKPADQASVDRARAWVGAGLAPFISVPAQGVDIYAFIDTPAGRQAVKMDADAQKALRAGGVKMAMVIVPPNAGASVLGYVKLRAATEAVPPAPATPVVSAPPKS